LDSKAGNLIGFISVVVGLLLGAGALKIEAMTSDYFPSVIFFVGIGILLASIGLALASFRVRTWIAVPNVTTLINNYTTVPYDEVLKRNGGEMAKAVVDSVIQNDNKANLLRVSWYFLISGLCTMFIFVIAYTLLK
jgi:hypothetical protein